jgi:hypothetical protein
MKISGSSSRGIRTTLAFIFVVVATVVAGASPARADGARSITAMDMALTEDFNTLSSTSSSSVTPSGWTLAEIGTGADVFYGVDNGSSNTGNTYSYGASSSTERAFGTLRSFAVQPELRATFRNDTQAMITSATVAYRGEHWRQGEARESSDPPDRLDFSYSTDGTNFLDGDALDYVAPVDTGPAGARDGNLDVNSGQENGTIDAISIPPGGSLTLRWTDRDISGSDDGIAIDDFSLTAHAEGGGGGGGGGGTGCEGVTASPTTQCTSVTVNAVAPGELSISLAQASVDFGSLDPGASSAPTPVGDISYRNTLTSGQVWSPTVAATSLVSDAGDVIPYTGMAFTPGATVTPDGPAPGSGGTFTGATAETAGSFSDPLTLITASQTDRGNFTHPGSEAAVTVPSDADAGAHAGTLQYTITG